MFKCSFFSGNKEHRSCLARSKAPELSGSVSPSASCFQVFTVAREPRVSSPLVPRKGNQEYDTAGVRTLLFDKAAVQHCLVEISSKLPLHKVLRWFDHGVNKSGVKKGSSSLCAETFAEIRRPARCGFCDSGTYQGPTHRGNSLNLRSHISRLESQRRKV
jgi:hypothetical protein